MIRLPNTRRPTHPGTILLREFLEPTKMTQSALATAIGASRVRINELVKGKRAITPDTALRLERLFGVEAEFWLNLQQAWDLWGAKASKKTQRSLDRISPLELTA